MLLAVLAWNALLYYIKGKEEDGGKDNITLGTSSSEKTQKLVEPHQRARAASGEIKHVCCVAPDSLLI
jgi:hypothetical protein